MGLQDCEMNQNSIRRNGVHVLVFPFPAQGHMLPLLDLAHELSLKGLTITILITPKNLPILAPLLRANPSIKTLVFPFPTTPSIPDGVENLKDLGNHGNMPMILALSKLRDPIIQWFESCSDPPAVILADFFLGWTHDLAVKLKIRRITFYSSGAFLTSVADHLWGNAESFPPGSEIKLEALPGAPTLTWEQAPSVFRNYKEGKNSGGEVVKRSMTANSVSWAAVFNTFEALEDEFLDYLRQKMGHPRVYSVGPLHLAGGHADFCGENNEKSCSSDDVLSWLDRCDEGSVLYVCFGSQKLLKKPQTEALADGLERSGVKFIWVVKQPTAQQVADGYGSVPDQFQERLTGRGYILNGWAPQSSILSHRAVGGFLSHCGWNSVVEAVASGVMILSWPMEADQFVNDKLLVEYKRAAIRVCEGGEMVPDSVELARVVKECMGGDLSEKCRAKEMKDKALEAVKFGGSSCKDLDGLVQEIAHLEDYKSL